MKLVHAYAQGLYDLAEGADDSEQTRLVECLVALLRRRGHFSLLPRIIREYTKIKKARMERGPQLVCAQQSQAERYRQEVARYLKNTDVAVAQVRIDSTLVGGFVFKQGDTVIDASYKTHLLNLYRRIIN